MERIGRVIEVSTNYIKIEINNLKSLSYNYKGYSYSSKGINEYIFIPTKSGKYYIYQTVKAEDIEKFYRQDEKSKVNHSGILTCVPVGMIEDERINFNLFHYPFLNDSTYLASKDILDIIYASSKTYHGVQLGVTVDGFLPNFELENLISNHTAVLGNTGSGKSTTIRKVLDEITNKPPKNLKIHILDVHGEYESSKIQNFIKFEVNKNFKIFAGDLDLQDWVNLFNPSDQVQLPILQSALKISSKIKSLNFRRWLDLYISYSLFTKIQTDPIGKRVKIGRILSEHFDIDLSRYSVQYGNFPSTNDQNKFITSLKKKWMRFGKTVV